MGGCESCASTRRKEVQCYLQQSMAKGDASELRAAIEKAEALGIDALPARQQYSELQKQERQSPANVQEMLRWAMNMQDGVLLYNVIQEVNQKNPNHEELNLARKKLNELQDETKLRLQRLAKNRDVRSLGVALDRARHMGIPAHELTWAEQFYRGLEETHSQRTSVFASPTGSHAMSLRDTRQVPNKKASVTSSSAAENGDKLSMAAAL